MLGGCTGGGEEWGFLGFFGVWVVLPWGRLWEKAKGSVLRVKPGQPHGTEPDSRIQDVLLSPARAGDILQQSPGLGTSLLPAVPPSPRCRRVLPHPRGAPASSRAARRLLRAGGSRKRL